MFPLFFIQESFLFQGLLYMEETEPKIYPNAVKDERFLVQNLLMPLSLNFSNRKSFLKTLKGIPLEDFHNMDVFKIL